jgi:hypothetical protein
MFMYVLSGWLLLQAVLSLHGFYYEQGYGSSRFLLLILPPLIFIFLIMSTARGQHLVGQSDLKWLMLIHILRIPVELVLWWLFIHEAVPRVMTFEGRNLDVLAGITAPVIYYFGYVKNQLSFRALLVWNFVSLALLLNIVVIAVLSMPFPTQRFGFEQPDIALFYFPFIWLPGCLVPMVVFAHVFTIWQLLNKRAMIFKG